MMRESGESIALLMACVYQNAIFSNDLKSLNGFVKASLQNPNVVYAFYFRTDGRLLTRFFDRNHPKIKTYLRATGKNRYNKILAGAKNDSSVMIVDKNITFDGDILGSVQVGIDKSAVTEKFPRCSNVSLAWFNIFLDKLQGVVSEIAGTAGSLATSSDALAGLSAKLSDGAQGMSGMSSTVASAAKQMSANMNTVVGSSDEAATTVEMVSAAAEEMTATINEIAMNTEKPRTIFETAVTPAGEATSRMGR